MFAAITYMLVFFLVFAAALLSAFVVVVVLRFRSSIRAFGYRLAPFLVGFVLGAVTVLFLTGIYAGGR